MWFTTFAGVRITNSTDWAFSKWIIAGAVTVAIATSITNILRKMAEQKDGASTRAEKLRSSLTQVNPSIWRFYKPKGQHDVDIVFFHGLQESEYEDAFWKTWLAKDDDQIIWPKDWLSKHLPNARILSVSYNSSASDQKGDSLTIIGDRLVEDIILDAKNDIGQNCPVFFVGHCLGGIIIKQFLVQAVREKAEMNLKANPRKIDRFAKFLENFKGAFFYGVPSGGVHKSIFDEFTSRLKGGSPILKLLRTLNTERGRVNENFRQLRGNWDVRIFGLMESRETIFPGFKGVVVPEASSRQDSDGAYTHQNADHFTICKATGINDFTVIVKLTAFITDPDIGLTIQHTKDLEEVV